jgi:hypothetical protein
VRDGCGRRSRNVNRRRGDGANGAVRVRFRPRSPAISSVRVPGFLLPKIAGPEQRKQASALNWSSRAKMTPPPASVPSCFTPG